MRSKKIRRPLAKAAAPVAMQFIHLEECRSRLCAGPVPVDQSAFVKSLMHCTNGERREVADLLLAETFGEL